MVEEVGAGVDGLAVSDQVVIVAFVASCGQCEFCGSGRPNLVSVIVVARTAGTLQTGSRHLFDERPVAAPLQRDLRLRRARRSWCRVRSCGSIRTCPRGVSRDLLAAR